MPSIERETAFIAKRDGKPRMDEGFPEIRIENHMTNCPFTCNVWNHPVETKTVSHLFLVFGHGLAACSDIATVSRIDYSAPLALPTELVYDVS